MNSKKIKIVNNPEFLIEDVLTLNMELLIDVYEPEKDNSNNL